MPRKIRRRRCGRKQRRRGNIVGTVKKLSRGYSRLRVSGNPPPVTPVPWYPLTVTWQVLTPTVIAVTSDLLASQVIGKLGLVGGSAAITTLKARMELKVLHMKLWGGAGGQCALTAYETASGDGSSSTQAQDRELQSITDAAAGPQLRPSCGFSLAPRTIASISSLIIGDYESTTATAENPGFMRVHLLWRIKNTSTSKLFLPTPTTYTEIHDE